MKYGNFAHVPLIELIKARKFDRVSPDITDKRFPIPGRLWNDYKVFHFGEGVSSKEIVKRIQAGGYEPANSHELLLWEGWNGEDIVVALGSVAKIRGYRSVLYLDTKGLKWNLYFSWWGGIWDISCHFLAVRKPSVPNP